MALEGFEFQGFLDLWDLGSLGFCNPFDWVWITNGSDLLSQGFRIWVHSICDSVA